MDPSLRLREEWEVAETRRKGKAYTSGPLVARILPRDTPESQNRYAVIAGKRVGGAVERNRCKRLLREALRALHPQLRQGYDIAVIVRGRAADFPGLAPVSEHLTKVFRHARLLEAPARGATPSNETADRPS